MTHIDLIGEIIKRRAESISDDQIRKDLIGRGEVDFMITQAFNAIEEDLILTIHSIPYFTPISPVTYKLGIRKIEKEIRVLRGVFKNTIEVAVRTVDKVNVVKNLLSADVAIMHSGETQITISLISRSDAEKIRQMYSYVIEAQRKSIVNITQD